MAEVKWQARRISDSVLVDVTADIEGTPAGTPTANPLEAGDAITISETDPGAVGPEALWIRTFAAGVAAGQDPTLQLFIRNSANDGWLRVGMGDYLTHMSDTSEARQVLLENGTEVAKIETSTGPTVGGNTSGHVRLYTATTSQLVGSISINRSPNTRQIEILHYNGAGTLDFSLVLNDSGIKMTGLPTADPVVANQLWIDTAAGRVIKVSAG